MNKNGHRTRTAVRREERKVRKFLYKCRKNDVGLIPTISGHRLSARAGEISSPRPRQPVLQFKDDHDINSRMEMARQRLMMYRRSCELYGKEATDARSSYNYYTDTIELSSW